MSSGRRGEFRSRGRARESRNRLSLVVAGHVCVDRNVVDGTEHISPGSPAYFIAQTLRDEPAIATQVIAPHGSDFDAVAPWLPIVTPTRGGSTLHFENTITSAARTQRATGLDLAAPSRLTSAERSALRTADIILLTPLVDRYPAAYVSSLIDAASPGALVALLPQGYLRGVEEDGTVVPQLGEALQSVAQECSLIVFSEDDVPDSDGLAWRLAELDNRPQIVITRAERGATVVTDIDSVDVPTAPIPPGDIVNPVGPGDVFAAACAIAMRRGFDVADAIRAGHDAATRLLTMTLPPQ